MILDEQGLPAPDETVDLSVRAKESDAPRVIETLRPEDYGIEVMDYLV